MQEAVDSEERVNITNATLCGRLFSEVTAVSVGKVSCNCANLVQLQMKNTPRYAELKGFCAICVEAV